MQLVLKDEQPGLHSKGACHVPSAAWWLLAIQAPLALNLACNGFPDGAIVVQMLPQFRERLWNRVSCFCVFVDVEACGWLCLVLMLETGVSKRNQPQSEASNQHSSAWLIDAKDCYYNVPIGLTSVGYQQAVWVFSMPPKPVPPVEASTWNRTIPPNAGDEANRISFSPLSISSAISSIVAPLSMSSTSSGYIND